MTEISTPEEAQALATLWSFIVVYGIWIFLLAIIVGGLAYLWARSERNKHMEHSA